MRAVMVSGAAGKTGRQVVRALARRGIEVRALVRREAQAGPLLELGARKISVGDMRDPAAWPEAVQGARAVYHICPNMAPEEVEIGRLAVRAARDAGVEHFVYHSVLHPQTEAMPHHWNKLRVEEAILASSLPFTILQPASYMQNVLAGWNAIVTQGIYRIPYAVETRLAMVDLEDVAGVAAMVLTDTGHEGAIYELVGPETLSQREVADILSRKRGRPVRAESISPAVWERQARAGGLGEYQIETLLAMFRYYERHGFQGNPNVLGWLLGRRPIVFEEFVDRVW